MASLVQQKLKGDENVILKSVYRVAMVVMEQTARSGMS